MIKALMSRCGTICKFASSSLLSFVLDYCLFLLFSAATGNWAGGAPAQQYRRPADQRLL